MSLRHLSDDIILVTAPKEPLLCQKLTQVNEALISNNADSDVRIATIAARSGDPFAVQRLLGHADLKMATR